MSFEALSTLDSERQFSHIFFEATEEGFADDLVGELLECDPDPVGCLVVEFDLGLCDDCVQIGVEDANGMPRALVETGADEVREWAQQTYERYLERSAPFQA